MTFSHLHVASGYSLQYGTATPQAIAERAAEHGQSIVGLTDRDGLYGAVRWMLACQSAGISPVLGVDLAMEETSPVQRGHERTQSATVRRSPAHGGTWLDEDRPRVLLLAADARVTAHLSPEQITGLLDPTDYTGLCSTMARDAAGRARAAVPGLVG